MGKHICNDISDKGLISHMTPHQEDKQSNLKMGKEPEQTLLQGWHTEGPWTHEKNVQHH